MRPDLRDMLDYAFALASGEDRIYSEVYSRRDTIFDQDNGVERNTRSHRWITAVPDGPYAFRLKVTSEWPLLSRDAGDDDVRIDIGKGALREHTAINPRTNKPVFTRSEALREIHQLEARWVEDGFKKSVLPAFPLLTKTEKPLNLKHKLLSLLSP